MAWVKDEKVGVGAGGAVTARPLAVSKALRSLCIRAYVYDSEYDHMSHSSTVARASSCGTDAPAATGAAGVEAMAVAVMGAAAGTATGTGVYVDDVATAGPVGVVGAAGERGETTICVGSGC